MRHIVGTVFAVSLAGVAAIAATTAYLNSPLRIGPATTNTPTPAPGQTPAPEPLEPAAPACPSLTPLSPSANLRSAPPHAQAMATRSNNGVCEASDVKEHLWVPKGHDTLLVEFLARRQAKARVATLWLEML